MNENERRCSRCGRVIHHGNECIVDTPGELAWVFCSKACIKEWIEDDLVSDPELAEDGRAVPVGKHPATGATLYRLEPPEDNVSDDDDADDADDADDDDDDDGPVSEPGCPWWLGSINL